MKFPSRVLHILTGTKYPLLYFEYVSQVVMIFLKGTAYLCVFHNQESPQQLGTWFSEHFFRAKTCCLICHSFLLQRYKYGGKMSTKPRSIQLLRWFDFSQSETGKTIPGDPKMYSRLTKHQTKYFRSIT